MLSSFKTKLAVLLSLGVFSTGWTVLGPCSRLRRRGLRPVKRPCGGSWINSI